MDIGAARSPDPTARWCRSGREQSARAPSLREWHRHRFGRSYRTVTGALRSAVVPALTLSEYRPAFFGTRIFKLVPLTR